MLGFFLGTDMEICDFRFVRSALPLCRCDSPGIQKIDRMRRGGRIHKTGEDSTGPGGRFEGTC